jgi:hypothetical protein
VYQGYFSHIFVLTTIDLVGPKKAFDILKWITSLVGRVGPVRIKIKKIKFDSIFTFFKSKSILFLIQKVK